MILPSSKFVIVRHLPSVPSERERRAYRRQTAEWRGDQLVHVLVEVPKNLSKKQKETLRQFADLCDEKNHPKNKGFFDKFK